MRRYAQRVSRVTAKGQVTIPVTVRFALGIAPGDEVVFAVEDGRGVFRRAGGVLGRAGTLALPARAGAPPLERFLVAGDDAFAAQVAAARDGGHRIALPDAIVLDLLIRSQAAGLDPREAAECLRDVAAERAFRLDHARAVRAAIDAAAAGDDPLAAYADARL
jgi:AbrB family looped-hinge helix DNA binding protein